MSHAELQALCERGQSELMQTRYLEAADTLATAEKQAWDARCFDTLARLYLPLQEARRQIRQRCGEGAVQMHLFPRSATDSISPQGILDQCPHGQLLVGGWGSIQPALEIRRLARQRHLYVETFLGWIQPASDGSPILRIIPEERMPLKDSRTLEINELPADAPSGNAQSFAAVMALWEKIHLPFLQAANNESDPIRRMEACRLVLQVDPACELAHQNLAEVARTLARRS